MKGVTPEVVQTGATYDYNQISLTADGLDSWVGGTAKCYEVEFVGKLECSGSYINIAVEGASKQGSFSYVDNSEYNDIETGSYVRVKGFIVGTNSYLKVLPYSVEVTAAPAPDVPTAPKESDPRGKKWMELPAMNDSSLGYYYHSFDMNGKTYRNYSFGWDDSNKVAYWVAYPLCKFYTNSYNGKNNRHEEYFIKDPLLGDASPNPGKGYAGDYDRGHQIPSADRQCSELANGQTYYGTNMTAQSNPLNGGPWAQLEGYIRDFAKSSSDTTYVVTGCYVKDSSEWETDSDGMKIKVPTAYFKAVLVLKNGNWTGGAYWTPHKNYSSSYTSWAISIDELEQKTGLDLYVNLPEKIGASAAAAIEAATPGNPKWWR
jgi:DNA/RNA endonuclease G (NUC1)